MGRTIKDREWGTTTGDVIRVTEERRRLEVTETVTREKVSGVTETCTRETRHVEVTECTETREMTRVEERLHGVEVKDTHTHTHTQVARDTGGELAERVGTRCGI